MTSPIAPDHVYQIVSVSDPALSGDGSKLAFVRSRVESDRATTRSQIVMMDMESSVEADFTSGPKDGSPLFSPDGATLAFKRPDDADRPQIWLIPTSGGEARQLTSAVGGVTEFAWSPDSSSLAFVSNVDPDRPPDGEEDMPRVKVIRRIRYRDDGEGWRGDAFRHIFTVDVACGEVRQLTDGEGDDGSPAWSPDGSSIAFISDRGGSRDVKDRSAVYVVPASGGIPDSWSEGLINAGRRRLDRRAHHGRGSHRRRGGRSQRPESALHPDRGWPTASAHRRLDQDVLLRDDHHPVPSPGRPHSLRRRGEGRGPPVRSRRRGRPHTKGSRAEAPDSHPRPATPREPGPSSRQTRPPLRATST